MAEEVGKDENRPQAESHNGLFLGSRRERPGRSSVVVWELKDSSGGKNVELGLLMRTKQ